MIRKHLRVELPYVEFWLIPAILVFIVGLLSLLDLHLESQSACSASCACLDAVP